MWDIWNRNNQRLVRAFVGCFAMEAIAILRALHNKGYVHGDVKPENFLMGPNHKTDRMRRLYLVDLGLGEDWAGDAEGPMCSQDGGGPGLQKWCSRSCCSRMK
jgi:serine/threonine protein kinase